MLSSKDPGETITVTFDFSGLTSSVSAPSVTAAVGGGTIDPNPSAILSGSAQVVGAKVLQQITAGQNGTIYYLRCSAASGTNTFILSDYLPVVTK